ncbi:MAG: TerB family tellurite resistance protein [Rhodospirillales bacterium]|nr:MAG: TerB family tellurite resistance protein [Rhodospirillales bacterium]
MLDRLMALFGSDPDAGDTHQRKHHDTHELQMAAAALMVHAASISGSFEVRERDGVRAALMRHFQLAEAEAEELIEEAAAAAAQTTELYGILKKIRQHLDPDERVAILEMLWEVAYADGVIHDYEANLARRVAGLLYVSDRDSGIARKRAIDRLDAG